MIAYILPRQISSQLNYLLLHFPAVVLLGPRQAGGEYSSDPVSKANFEQLAEDAGLAKPLVRSRVPELAATVLSNLDKTGIEHPAAVALAAQIRECCDAF